VTEATRLRPTPHPAIETAFLENQAVLFDVRTGQVHELNPSASAVWLLLDGELTVEQIAAELHDLLGVPIETLRADAELIVADFARRGLLEGTEAVVEDDGHAQTPRRAASAPTVLARPPDP
jgi:hypothetical protein